MAIAQLVLEFVRILLSWPVVVLALGVFFLIKFRTAVSALMDRIAGIRFPGGSELLMPQATRNVLAATAETVVAAPQPEAGTEAEPHSAANAEQLVQTERERAHLWEYRYLNYFLVPRTQLVLDWLAGRQPTGVGTYDTWIMDFVPNPVERLAMLDALRNHHLIRIDGDLITVNPKGQEYIRWRGPARDFLTARLGPPPAGFPGPIPAVPPPAQPAPPPVVIQGDDNEPPV